MLWANLCLQSLQPADVCTPNSSVTAWKPSCCARDTMEAKEQVTFRGQDGLAAGSHQAPERDPPSEPSLPGRRGQVPAELPEGTSFERLQSGVSDQTYLPGRDPASGPALPGGHNVSRRSSLGSQLGSSQPGTLDRILENEYPELRASSVLQNHILKHQDHVSW